jgi:hypothetical protein
LVIAEAWYLLKKMQVTADDLENMMADMMYNETLRNQFLEPKPGTTDDTYVNEEVMRRQLICNWVNKNTPKIISQWLPTSATTRRCLGEEQFVMTSTGIYTPSTTCSGHGVCQPDPWLQYSGVCECYRGYEHRDCSILSAGEVVNAALYHPSDPKKGDLAEYWLFGCMIIVVFMVIISNWTTYVRDTPIFHNLASSHSFILLGSSCVVLFSYPFWGKNHLFIYFYLFFIEFFLFAPPPSHYYTQQLCYQIGKYAHLNGVY